MSTVRLLAPLDGWCLPLGEVPDEVFSGGMLGDGLAIDPTSSVVVAPAAGVVVTAAATAHAVTLRTAEGLELLVHVGVDTVNLAGRGFEMLVKADQPVRAGDALIRFDLDAVARAAKSLVTPLILTRADGFEIRSRHAPGAIRAGDVLFECVSKAKAEASAVAASLPATNVAGMAATRTLCVTLQHGIHARPAALLSQRVRGLGAEVWLEANGRKADARSVVAIMALGVRCGELLSAAARGADAERALDALAAGLEEARQLEHSAAAKSAGGDAATDNTAADKAAPIRAQDAASPSSTGPVLSGVRAARGSQ